MKYKVGDRVRIKSLDWYNKNKDEYGNIDINCVFTFYADRSEYCGKVFTISKVFDNSYFVKEDNESYYWTDEMIEGLVEEETCIGINIYKDGYIHGGNVVGNEITLPQGYQFVDENGNVINATKIVLEKKKHEYPKTYEECAKVAPMTCRGLNFEHYNKMLSSFYKLLVCRDAYWKIAGEEMGLGKPWKPDFESGASVFIINTAFGEISKAEYLGYLSHILAFPSAEMRDTFYENFKSEIESCKELL